MTSLSQSNRNSEQTTISVMQLPLFLVEHVKDAKVLSLDCFDTLLWRKVASPFDVFYQLQLNADFKARGLNASQRMRLESALRRSRAIEGLSSEVNLKEIYASAFDDEPSEAAEMLVQAEIDVEKELCFIFEPMCDLLVGAKKLGLKTVIVSDTYLNATQLRELITNCAAKIGRECPIDEVYVSSDFRRSKSDGLLRRVAKELKVRASDIVHLGDNLKADYEGAREVGVRGYHFLQFSPKTEAKILEQTNITSTLLPHIRHTHPLVSRWRQLWAASEEMGAIETIGKYTLAPVFFNFSYWIANQVKSFRENGEKPKLIFLMRDGYLASLTCRELALRDQRLQGVPMADLEISRFVALASSFNSKDTIIQYLRTYATTPAYEEILSQLLFAKAEIQSYLKKFSPNEDGLRKFYSEILQPQSVQKILSRSAAYRDRFYKRLREVASPQAGETLILVDLGYGGTIHNCMASLIENDFGVKVVSLFLLLNASGHKNPNLRGMISDAEYDQRLVQNLVFNVNPLEQICANDQPSVRNFLEDGAPQYADEVVPATQIKTRLSVQGVTLNFLRTWCSQAVPDLADLEMKDESVAMLGRFLLTPSKEELELFVDGIHDVNLGTSQTTKLINRAQDRAILQRRGLIGIGEIDKIGLAWRLAALEMRSAYEYVSIIRFTRGLRIQDDLHSQIPISFFSSNASGAGKVDVYRTHDGFLRAIVPVSGQIQAIALLLGQEYSWIQLRGAYLEPISNAFQQCDAPIGSIDLTSTVQFDGVKIHKDGIYQMEGKEAFLLLHPGNHQKAWGGKSMFCEVIFRPLVERSKGG